MALQQFVCVFTVAVILLCKGCYSQQPACFSGGQNAAEETWPWLAVFSFEGFEFCQGSLITDQWVLTAGQCSFRFSTMGYLSGSVVTLGVYYIQSNFIVVTRKIEYYICHQDLNFQNFENDICLVKLSAPVNFTDYIQPVCLAAEDSTLYDGTPSLVTYFKYSFYNPVNIEVIDVPIVGNNKCGCFYINNYYYYYLTKFSTTENQLCAGQEDGFKKSYGASLGTPLVTKKGSTWVQSGIASISYSSWLQLPTVYTRVSQYRKWISDRVSGMEPGFITFNSPGNDSDLYYMCPTTTPATPYPSPTPEITTARSTPNRFFTDIFNFTTPDDSIWNRGGNLIPFTHFISLSVLVLFLHVFVGSGGF